VRGILDRIGSRATNGNGVQAGQSPLMKDLTPGDCDRIIIVGAGGFGREVLHWARDAWPDHRHKLAGFLSADVSKLEGHPTSIPILGTPADFEPRPTDGLVLAIGIRGVRRQVAELIESHGGRFLSLVHPTAVAVDTAVLGTGCVVCPHAVVSDSVRMGRFVLVNYHASLGHDSSAGDFSVMSPYSTLGGHATIGADVFLAMHATVGPNVRVGDGSTLSANTCLLNDAPRGSLVFGVPGRICPYVVVSRQTVE
jgi:sugar O-acyltransferase (sialic acid O-acetyltransferase NeuD family)